MITPNVDHEGIEISIDHLVQSDCIIKLLSIILQSKSQVARSRLTFSLKLEQLHNTEPLLKEHIIIQWPVSHISG